MLIKTERLANRFWTKYNVKAVNLPKNQLNKTNFCENQILEKYQIKKSRILEKYQISKSRISVKTGLQKANFG